jgi:hypothetical protein
MRPVKRGDAPDHPNGKPLVFKQYGDANPYLISRIAELVAIVLIAKFH